MPSHIVLRLHPVEPVDDGGNFTSYLDNLTIEAFDLSYGDLDGALLGTAQFQPLPDPAQPWDPDPATGIVQHWEPNPFFPMVFDMQAVATAVIEVPVPPGVGDPPEHQTSDIRLEITRGGAEIIHRQIYYNVPLAPGGIPTPDTFPSIAETSLHLALPSGNVPGAFEMPENGNPPAFSDLLSAVNQVLQDDPGGTSIDAEADTLTIDQARHIALEIIWNRDVHPLPNPPMGQLQDMYTGARNPDDDIEQARLRFEADLQAYYSLHNSQAERLAGFVYSLAAAFVCSDLSENAIHAGFRFPVVLGPPDPGEKIREAGVVLRSPGTPPLALDPAFVVPPEYFYALGAIMSPRVPAEQRYILAILENEDNIRIELNDAVADGVIISNASVNIPQTSRRLRALGSAEKAGPEFTVINPSAVYDLVEDWLDVQDDDIADWWQSGAPDPSAHLDLVLWALTGGHEDLVNEIDAVLTPSDAADLDNRTTDEWRAVFGDPIDETLLPAFTLPGTPPERVEAFIRHVQRFFATLADVTNPAGPTLDAPPLLRTAQFDPFVEFDARYLSRAGVAFAFGGGWNPVHMRGAVSDVFPGDPEAQAWLDQAIRSIDELVIVTTPPPPGPHPPWPADLQFSLIEALYARGFTRRNQITALTLEDFRESLRGTVAYEYAAGVSALAGPAAGESPGGGGEFNPINPDGCLVNCIPLPHLSPLGPVSYLHDLLQLSADSTCEDPVPDSEGLTLHDLLEDRRGPLGTLLASRANLDVPLPLIDIVNESLEWLAADVTVREGGTVYNTNRDTVGGHALAGGDGTTTVVGEPEPVLHDPTMLFEALPEHSTPATPVAEQGAYDVLRSDFTAPNLPYPQALDVNRTYLNHLQTSRYQTMRRFREEITEFVLEPEAPAEPAAFQRHLWRYPVRIDIAREYLGISPEEYDLLFTQDIADVPTPGQLLLRELYGFPDEFEQGQHWTEWVVWLPEFLERTGLTYCEFLELWRSGYVRFHSEGADPEFPRQFDDCEPCDLSGIRIEFIEPANVEDALRQLAVFIRVWRKLHDVPNAGYSFATVRDLCVVFELFSGGLINPDFVRQLAAFQILRDDFRMALSNNERAGAPANGTGPDRTHLLALWEAPTNQSTLDWALDELLDQVQTRAIECYYCALRSPYFLKLLRENLEPLSRLAGFNPANPGDAWDALPTHTLRIAEVLSKVYASDFGVGEVLFLFTVLDHLAGDDPFRLQPPNEALEFPLDLPDDESTFSLWELRDRLLHVTLDDEDAQSWTWDQIETTMRVDFAYDPAGGDPLRSLGEHYFPSILEDSGISVPVAQRQYRTPLVTPSPQMWNTPPMGPFRYDTGSNELWTQLPITDEAVIAKLGRIRQLDAAEQHAVRELYFAPRAELAPFAFIFTDLSEAEERLIQEPDEDNRWRYFQREFATCYARCKLIAEHLADHMVVWTGEGHEQESALAWDLLRHLYADENRAIASWENAAGTEPVVTWPDQPSGGAFVALLGLIGTGLLGEYTLDDGSLAWRELRGPFDAFGSPENAANAPVPTILPALDLAAPPTAPFLELRNGFFLPSHDDALPDGAQGYSVRWTGVLMVSEGGNYEFRAGSPTPDGELPDFEAARERGWRVELRRGQRVWVILSNEWVDEIAPGDAASLHLQRGAYRITVDFRQPPPTFADPEDVCPVPGGFQLKYAGPDSGDRMIAIPRTRLYRDVKDERLDAGIDLLNPTAHAWLASRYTSSLRDIRRTYLRAFSALLFSHRFDLSAMVESDSGQSEIEFLLQHADNFVGTSYVRQGPNIVVHRAEFNFNFLPVLDNYFPPSAGQDQRRNPSPRRQAASFDWWERMFDYTATRRDTADASEPPLWLLFHEAVENHPDLPAHLRRHMGIRPLHVPLVLRFFEDRDLQQSDLEDERWAVRVWRAEEWIRAVRTAFLERDIVLARPDLWASDDPIAMLVGETESGNENLTSYLRNGCLENDEPLRYEDIKILNDGLRLRGRAALLDFLCGMDRVSLPWGEVVTEPRDLSELLLIDVEAGICQRASRIEEAVSAVQAFVQRARLGLEPTMTVTEAFALLWDRRFATFWIWERCKRREVYRENWIEWDELEQARRGEAFRFLEAELRRSALTIPVPAGLEYWPNRRPPQHPGLAYLQSREPATIRRLEAHHHPEHHGLDLLGTPERHARPSWLSGLGVVAGNGRGNGDDDVDVDSSIPVPGTPNDNQPEIPDTGEFDSLPFWIQAAIRLGVRFVRVAAAAEPLASTAFAPRPDDGEPACCVECGKPHPALVDEYYFWLIDSRQHLTQEQDAGWTWDDPNELPSLLYWDSEPAVHLAWCRVHNGEFKQPRRSDEGVQVVDASTAVLEFTGRSADSLTFEVSGGIAPTGNDPATAPGFRYDLATDSAVTLPLVVAPPPFASAFPGGLLAYPYFAYHAPGAPLFPPSLFGPAIAVAANLRMHCRFEAALKWYELVFDPLHDDAGWIRCAPRGTFPVPIEDDEGGEFNEITGTATVVDDSNAVIGRGGLCCTPIALTEEDTRARAITLHYLETLVQWGDAEMRRNTPEAFQKARVIFDTLARILGPRPRTAIGEDEDNPPEVQTFIPHGAPLNPRLLALYDLNADRLSLIQSCLNASRLRNGRSNIDMPYWGNRLPGDPWRSAIHPCVHDRRLPDQVCLDDEDWCCPHSPYRFTFLIGQAQELANEVRGLGATLLTTYEKGDAEFLASLRATHERQVLNLALEVRQNQWRDADWQVQALQKTREITQTRRRYYQNLLVNDLNTGELQYESLTGVALSFQHAGRASEIVAQAVSWIPDIEVGTVGPLPTTLNRLPLGTKLAGIFTSMGRVSDSLAGSASLTGGLRLTESGWVRREEEWRHQVEVLDLEIEQIERQILGAQRRRDVAVRDLNNHQRQIEHSTEVHDFLRDKFTSHELFLWLQQETAALHHQMYELALHTARQAQRAFNYERGHTSLTFITADDWDNLREGLLAGDRLQLALRQMEKTYLDQNIRTYELTKDLSLRLHFPLEFLRLLATGSCEIELEEWMFDLDYPGHFLRQIKNVTLTLPSVVGPYTGIHCRLTLLSSMTRVQPYLIDPPGPCCPPDEPENGYRVIPDDPRIVRQYAATEAIATSSGQNDAGLFELNFRDERYLPFEFAGAVSRWRIELPPENNQFDLETLSDVVMHLNFAAREGGETLRQPANELAQPNLPGAGMRFFDVRHDLSDAWMRLQERPLDDDTPRELPLRLGRNMFAYLPAQRPLFVNRLELFFEEPGATPSEHRIVTVLVWRPGADPRLRRPEDCKLLKMRCVAGADWPGMYHGVVDQEDLGGLLGPLSYVGNHELVTLEFPSEAGVISNAYLVCGYETGDE
jgi:hypothetical protein